MLKPLMAASTAGLAGVAVSLLLASCGGSAPGPAPTTPPNGGVTPPASLSLQLDRVLVKNAGDPPVKVTVTAVNASGQAVPSAPISLSVDQSASVAPGVGTTNNSGQFEGTVSLLNKANRVVTVTATSGSVTRTAQFAVTGAQLTYTINTPSVAVGAQAQVVFNLRDANDQPMPNEAITLSSSLNNFAPIAATTNASGQYTLSYTPATSGNDQITASAGGATPLSPPTIVVGSTALPNPSTTPRTFSFQVSPSVVDVNLTGTSNRAALIVRVFGDNGVPVQNAAVTYRLAAGSQFGSLATTQVVLTDATGTARTDFIPGPAASAQDQVIACASVAGGTAAPSNPRAGCNATESGGGISVRGSAVSVVIAPSSVVIVPDPLRYNFQYLVQVASVGGGPIQDALVTVESLEHPFFYRGTYSAAMGGWTRVNGSPFQCVNEDANRNDILDPMEDRNGNGVLDPRRPVNVRVLNNGRTDSFGQVIVEITYPKAFATWLDMDITVRVVAGGSEGRSTWRQYPLPASAEEIRNVNSSPAFQISPFGVSLNCTAPN